MSKLNKSIVDQQPHEIYKTFVNTLARILFPVMNAFVNHKKHSTLKKELRNC